MSGVGLRELAAPLPGDGHGVLVLLSFSCNVSVVASMAPITVCNRSFVSLDGGGGRLGGGGLPGAVGVSTGTSLMRSTIGEDGAGGRAGGTGE